MVGRCALRAVHDLDGEREDWSKGLLGYFSNSSLYLLLSLSPHDSTQSHSLKNSPTHSCNLQWLSALQSVTPVAVDPAGSFGINIASQKSLSIWIASVYNPRSTAFVAEWRQVESWAQCWPGHNGIAPGPSTETNWGVSKGPL